MSLAGTLYVVGTPIGNLEDISLRALRVLKEVALVAAEDTRHTRGLLAHYGIGTPLVSYREQNRARVTQRIVGVLAETSVALVSDAGMPGLADPGADLVAHVVALGGRVEVVPGAVAAIAALLGSGLPPAPFTFVGFLSRQRGDRLRQLEALAGRTETLVIYEAPHRLRATLGDLLAVLGDRQAAACRELTKRFEEMRRARLSELAAHYAGAEPRGEFTLVVQGATDEPGRAALSAAEVDERLGAAMRNGDDMRATVSYLAAESGLGRREVYARWQQLRRAAPPEDGQ